jgi:hypothetical protein
MDSDSSDVVYVRPKIVINDTNEITRRLTIWWNKSYGMVKGQRNNNMAE